MPGLLTHLSVVLTGFLITYLIFYKNSNKIIYGLSFGLGHLIPDLIDFGIAGIKQRSLNPAEIMTNPLFRPLAILGHTFTNWLIFASIIILIIIFLYTIKKISKQSLVKIIILLFLFIIGTFIHIQLDLLIIETSYWI